MNVSRTTTVRVAQGDRIIVTTEVGKPMVEISVNGWKTHVDRKDAEALIIALQTLLEETKP